ncbi:MAG TPA: dihydrolipoamide acetyltransferase family protein [Pseudobdellovibrionaceae bacterium]|nr:dihydrolipoamide acetyltransferase family protein [Pseudobdellovibrionaceae bacterium]
MATDIKLPELGEGINEGELIKWLVKPGDQVKPDQAVAEIMTDKATVEVPSPSSGTIKELKFKEGDVIKVDSVIISMEAMTTSVATPAAAKSAATASKPAAATITAPVSAAPASTPLTSTPSFFPPVAESRVLATPATRRLAREINVDINELQGSGLAGRVTQDDVLSAKDSNSTSSVTKAPATQFPKPSYQGPTGSLEERVPLRGIRKKIAENLQMAKHIIPHFTLMDEANVSELVKMREGLKDLAEKNQTKITYLPFVIKALVSTMREYPMFNASIDDQAQEIVYKKYFNIGFAADTPNGLVVPVIKNADQKTILELSKEIIELSKKARDGKLKPDEMKGATISITNIGSVGGTYATPIINHPEVAILGMYKIQDKLTLKDTQVVAQKAMNYTITADHRLIDGAVAANFLKSMISKLENPAVLMMNMY